MTENILLDLNINGNNKDNNNTKKKRKLSQLEKDIIKLNYLSNLKIKKEYNCTKKIYEKTIITYLLNNANCHLVSIFKEKMLTDYVDEFLRREYSRAESSERIPKFAIYYKNYLLFFCQPTFSNFVINDIINDYGERRAELYYKNNYQGGKSNENEDLGFEESDSEEETDKEMKFKNNENGEIFDNSIKENIENVTIMTTINNSKNNTINLNLNNEKIEVFSENKCDKSNDTTLHDLMDIVKKGQEEFNKRKKFLNSKIDNNQINHNNHTHNNVDNNDINNNDNNSSNNNNYTSTNFNKSKKSNNKNKKKNDIFNIIDYKKAMLNRGLGNSQSKKKEGSKSLKKHLEKNNLDKVNKIKNKFSIDKLQKLFKKGGTNIKNLNNNNKNYKFPINNFLNIVNKNNHDKLIFNSNLKKFQEKELKDKEKDSISNKKTNKKIFNHSVNLNIKNKSISKDKDQDKKIIKNTGNNNRFNSIKNFYGNINNNILQNNYHNNNYNFYIGGHGTNKYNSKSRNNTGFLYKQQSNTNTNNIINNNIMYNLNNIYKTTSLHKLFKNLNNNNRNNAYIGKINPFKTLNFMQTTNHHQRYNNNFQINNIENKYHISNTSQDNKSSSVKILLTDLNNQNRVKPSIKLQNEKDLIKSKYNNRDNNNIYDFYNNKNHRITKSYNNLNLNNIHTNNGITSYNNVKYKNKKIHNNSKNNHNLKNIKGNQINSNSSNKNKKADSNNKDLMQLALSLLLDNNSTFTNMVGNNNFNNIHNNNNNIINKKSFISRNNNRKSSIKKSKTNYNNYKNKYHNNNTNYNININNQININTNSNANSNNLYNNLKSGKDYLNTKLKNQELNINNNNIKEPYINNFLYTNSNLHVSSCNGINNHNHNSENINLNKKIRAKNFHSGLKKGNIFLNKNNNAKKEENIIKSYHTKSVSSLTDLINHNKKLTSQYKNVSKSKSKEHK